MRRRTTRKRNRKHAFGHPRTRVRHVELPLHPNRRPVALRVERQPQAIVERGRIAHVCAERGEEGAGRPSAFMLFVILRRSRQRDEQGYFQQREVSPTSFSRRASSASVCGGTYFAETRRRTLVLTVRLLAALGSGSTSTCCRLFVFCPVYASLRRTASLYNTRSDALAAHRLNVLRTTALVLANADARSSSSSASTAGAFPFPLLFPFRIAPADAGAAVGDAISTSCGDGRDAPPFLGPGAAFGKGSGSAAVY